MKGHRTFQATGPGLKKALQKAIDEGKQFETVHEWDDSGTITKFGYRLYNKGQPREKRGEIFWFDLKDIEIIYENRPSSRPIGTRELYVEYSLPQIEKKLETSSNNDTCRESEEHKI